MIQKFVLTLIILVMVHLSGFSQKSRIVKSTNYPIVAEEGISSITASENIDLILIQDNPETVGVKVPESVMKKIKISLNANKLFISSSSKSVNGERLPVYVWVNNLENLILEGNAFATSTGVLNSEDLHISAEAQSMVALKSKGKVWLDLPSNYQVFKGNGYYFVKAGEYKY